MWVQNTLITTHSRGIQRPDAQLLINNKVKEIGADSPFDDAPLVQTWGRPEMSGTRPLSIPVMSLAIQANYMHTLITLIQKGGIAFSIVTLTWYTEPVERWRNHNANNEASVFKTGYTPYLDGAQKDSSFVIGVKGEIGADTIYDVLALIAISCLMIYLYRSSVRFKIKWRACTTWLWCGWFRQSKLISMWIFLRTCLTHSTSPGAEWQKKLTQSIRELTLILVLALTDYPALKMSMQESIRRQCCSLHWLEHDISDDLLIQYALRYEDFSDFGDTVNGKVATRYLLSDDTPGSLSLVFMPTPGQVM